MTPHDDPAIGRRRHTRSGQIYVGVGLLIALLVVALVLCGLAFAGLNARHGTRNLNVVPRGERSVSGLLDEPRLSPAVRLALADQSGVAEAGALAWLSIADGFDVTELPVVAGGAEADRIQLARVDPNRFRFVVRYASAGRRGLGDWMRELGAALVINGSYFSIKGSPDTPIVSAGVRLGPQDYEARHGAFVVSKSSVHIHDLARENWRTVLQGADDAMVSYPLLVAEDRSNRVNADPRRLANRSFVGEDKTGSIVVGTTKEAYFSLERFATFLRDAPLQLKMALNLDGGPLACQGIALNGFNRDVCGNSELTTHDQRLPIFRPASGGGRPAMPIVLAVLSK